MPALTPGTRAMALGAFWFSVMAALVKALGTRLPSGEIVLVRALLNLAMSWWLLRRAGVSPWGNQRGLLLVRGVFGFLALSFFYASLTRLPLAEANLIQLSNPIYTALLAALLLRERMRPAEIACVAGSLAGMLIVVRPTGFATGGVPLNHALLALAGAVCSACAYVTIRRLTGEHPLVVVFYFPLVTVPGTLPFVVGRLVWPTPVEWLLLLAVGVTTQAAQMYLTRGLQQEPAGRATAIGSLQVVFAAVWGVMLFAETPDLWTVAGGALILASTAALAALTARPAAPAA